jgi:hypothetical protein
MSGSRICAGSTACHQLLNFLGTVLFGAQKLSKNMQAFGVLFDVADS